MECFGCFLVFGNELYGRAIHHVNWDKRGVPLHFKISYHREASLELKFWIILYFENSKFSIFKVNREKFS